MATTATAPTTAKPPAASAIASSPDAAAAADRSSSPADLKPPSSTTAGPPSTATVAAGEQATGPADTGAEAGPAESEADVGPAGTGSVVDMDVFGQLLEIDDDEEHEFSKTLAFDYITQADATFQEIEEALASKDLDALSRKGHFLKGSSAALGLQRVQHSCEAMQHFGKKRDAHGEGPEVSDDEALARCRALLVRLKKEQEEARTWLEEFFATGE
ncbi:hypothetical protein JCM3775_004152 [Rhodotorula graminis]